LPEFRYNNPDREWAEEPYQRDCDYKNKYDSEEEAVESINVYSEKVPINSFAAYYCHIHRCWHKGHSLNPKQLKQLWVTMNWWRLENLKDFNEY
jgi:hypothetical protein